MESTTKKCPATAERAASGRKQARQAYSGACGKFILTGEHAVVHGRTAIACPVRWGRVYARIEVSEADNWYAQRHPLVRHSLSEIGLDRWFEMNPDNRLVIDGNLPIGIGLGASAAVIVALIRLDEQIHGYSYNFDDALALGCKCEDFVHGRSSGLDIAVALKERPVLFSRNGIDISDNIAAQHFTLVNTGTPTRSTGECVKKVGDAFPGDAAIWDDFADISETIRRDGPTLTAIRRNHALLCEIGVVPDFVQSFVRAVEEAGGAAKISGGGNIDRYADTAGIVIVTGLGEQRLREICDGYGYSPVSGQH